MFRIPTSRTRSTAPKSRIRRRLGIERLEDRLALSGLPSLPVATALLQASPALRGHAMAHIAPDGHQSHPSVAHHQAPSPHHPAAKAHLPGSGGLAKPGTPAVSSATLGGIHALGSPSTGVGFVTATIDGNTYNSPNATIVQPDGKIVSVGTTKAGTNFRFGAVRFNADGSLDTSFGGDGQVSTPWTAADVGVKNVTVDAYSNAAVLQADGKLVVAGAVRWGSFNSPTIRLALARYNPDGSLDTTFNKTGKVVTALPSGNASQSVDGVGLETVNGATKIVVGTTVVSTSGGKNFAVARYNLDGSLDTSFGGTGLVTTDFAGKDDIASGMVVQPDGKVVLGGRVQRLVNGTIQYSVGLVRYNPDGTLDTSFGGTGKVMSNLGSSDGPRKLALQPDGKLVMTMDVGLTTNDQFVAIRYNADASLDTTFGTGGIVDLNIGTHGQASSVAVQDNPALANYGDIYLAGYSNPDVATSTSAFAVVRLTPNGQLDQAFGTGGVATIRVGETGSSNAIALAPADGKIVLGGSCTLDTSLSSNYRWIGVARFNTDGSADATF